MPVTEGSAAQKPMYNMFITGPVEAIGTFFLCIAGFMAIRTAAETGDPRGLLKASAWFGIGLGLQINVWYISGCHLNPFPTWALAIAGKFPWRYVPSHNIGQFIGAYAAGKFAFGDFGKGPGDPSAAIPMFGNANGPLHAFLSVFLFCLVIILLAGDSRATPGTAWITIGAALGLGIYFFAGTSGGGLNLARNIAPMILADKYVWGPSFFEALGALAAGLFYRVLAMGQNPSKL